MVRGQFKSRTFRRVFVKTPGNRVVLHYEKRKPAKAKCASCGDKLAGVAHVRAVKLKRIARTAKRPTRPFGGQYCSKCSRRQIIARARK